MEQIFFEVNANATSASQNVEKLATSFRHLATAQDKLAGAKSIADQLSRTANSIKQLPQDAGASAQQLSALASAFSQIQRSQNKLANADKIGNKMRSLRSSIQGFEGAGATGASLGQLGSGLGKLATGQRKLAESGNIGKVLAETMRAVNQIGTINPESVQTLHSLAESLKPLGTRFKNIGAHAPLAASGLRSLIDSLNQMPMLNANAKSLLLSLEKIPSVSGRVASASNAMGRGFQSMGKHASTSSNSLLRMIGMAKRYLVTGLMIRAFSKLREFAANSVADAMHFNEAVNYFNVSYGELAETAGEYYETMAKTLGLDVLTLVEPAAIFQQIARSIGMVNDQAFDLSSNLVKIGLDLASLTDKDFKDVYEDLQSGIMSGQTKPMRKYGVDLTETSLQSTLDKQKQIAEAALRGADALDDFTRANYEMIAGLNSNVETMTQTEKIWLRYMTLYDAAGISAGDFAKTLDEPANAMRVFKSAVTGFARDMGSIFIPIISRVLPYVTAFARVLQETMISIGLFFGYSAAEWENSDFRSSIDDDMFGGVSESAGGASSAVTELKKNIMGFDQFNILKEDKPSGGSGSGGSGGGVSTNLPDFTDWDLMLEKINGDKVVQIMNDIKTALRPLGDAFQQLRTAVEPLRQPLKDLWNNVFVPLGGWALGSGLPALVNIFADLFGWISQNREEALVLLSILGGLKLLNGVSIGIGAVGAVGAAGAGAGAGGVLGGVASMAAMAQTVITALVAAGIIAIAVGAAYNLFTGGSIVEDIRYIFSEEGKKAWDENGGFAGLVRYWITGEVTRTDPVTGETQDFVDNHHPVQMAGDLLETGVKIITGETPLLSRPKAQVSNNPYEQEMKNLDDNDTLMGRAQKFINSRKMIEQQENKEKRQVIGAVGSGFTAAGEFVEGVDKFGMLSQPAEMLKQAGADFKALSSDNPFDTLKMIGKKVLPALNDFGEKVSDKITSKKISNNPMEEQLKLYRDKIPQAARLAEGAQKKSAESSARTLTSANRRMSVESQGTTNTIVSGATAVATKSRTQFGAMSDSFGGNVAVMRGSFTPLPSQLTSAMSSAKDGVGSEATKMKNDFVTKQGQLKQAGLQGFYDVFTGSKTSLKAIAPETTKMRDDFVTKQKQVKQAGLQGFYDVFTGSRTSLNATRDHTRTTMDGITSTIEDSMGSGKLAAKLRRDFANGWAEVFDTIQKNGRTAAKGVYDAFRAANTVLGVTTGELTLPTFTPIPRYATGGFPSMGEIFMANENGIEGFGKLNNKSVVVNNSQIIEGVSQGVANAIASANASNSGGSSSDYQTIYKAVNNAIKDASKGKKTQYVVNGKVMAEAVTDEINAVTGATGTCPIKVF